jgi:hypothetical protein
MTPIRTTGPIAVCPSLYRRDYRVPGTGTVGI